MKDPFYLHINALNLAHYYRCACIKPSKFFDKRIDDIQTIFDSFILLSNKRYAKGMDCSLELVLTEEEQSVLIPLRKNKDILLYRNVIPITRIKKIYFPLEDIKDKVTTAINMGSGFIPFNFANVLSDNNNADYSGIDLPSNIVVPDLAEKVRMYDSLLGGFALMRLSGEEYMNYSENYFSTLSRFNSVIEAELQNANKKINRIYWDVFEGQNEFKLLFPFINKKLTEDDLNELVKKENQKIQKSNYSGIIDINALDRASYIIAVLYSYGIGDEGRKNKIDGLILNNFKKEIKYDKSEVVSLCYGLNRGYSVFTNKYRIESKEIIVKFELNSQVDYYTIESIFQFVFNGVSKSSKFPYLDTWCPKYSTQNSKLRKWEYIVLDKVIVGEQIKVGSAKWWSNIMQFFFQKNSEELFKPFILKVFEKIKTDIEEDFQEVIEQKNDELLTLKNENIKLKDQNKIQDNLKNQVELLKKELYDAKSKSNVIYEKEQDYEKKSTIIDESIDYKARFLESQRFINQIGDLITAAKAKTLIRRFKEKYPQTDDILPLDK